MPLETLLKIKIFYFELEIQQERSRLQKMDLDSSLIAIQYRLSTITSEIYLKSNLIVTDSYYEMEPFKLCVIMEGTEYQADQSVDNKSQSNVLKNKFHILQLEIINKMDQKVKNKIFAKGYTLNQIAASCLMENWIKSNDELLLKELGFRSKLYHYGAKIYKNLLFDQRLQMITDINFYP